MSPNPVAINCMAFNHNSSLLITGASDGMIRLFGKQLAMPWPSWGGGGGGGGGDFL